MKNRILGFLCLLWLMLGHHLHGQNLATHTGHIKFTSTTSSETIEANNYKVTGSLSKGDGVLVFSVPMQRFEFEKASMQKHFNQPDFLDTDHYPEAKFEGKINEPGNVNYYANGVYSITVEGNLTLHGVTNPIKVQGTLDVAETGLVKGKATFNLTLADYNVVLKGKAAKKVAKTVELTVNMEYRPER